MNRLLSFTLALSFALAGCALENGVDESENNGDFLSKPDDVLIIVSRSIGIDEATLGLDSDDETEIWIKQVQNANELVKFYREEKNANVEKMMVHALASDKQEGGIEKEFFDFFDNRVTTYQKRGTSYRDKRSHFRYTDDEGNRRFGDTNDRNFVNSLLEYLDDQDKTYDRVIIMAPAHDDGPVFSGNLVPGVNYPSPRVPAYSDSVKDSREQYLTEMYGALGKITKPGGWIYFTGVNPQKRTGFDGFNNFLDMASCLTGRHTVASRTDSLMWKEHTRIMKIDKSNTVDDQHFTEGIELQTPCDATQDASMSCRDADDNQTCAVRGKSYSEPWGECPSGICVNIDFGSYSVDNTTGGQCPGPANIRCSKDLDVVVYNPPPAPSNVHLISGEPERCGRGKGALGWCVDTNVGNEFGDCSTVSRLSSMTKGACFGGTEIRCCPDENVDGLPAGEAPEPTDDGGTPIISDGASCKIVREDLSSTQGVCASFSDIVVLNVESYSPQSGDCANTVNPVCVFVSASDDGTDYGLGNDSGNDDSQNTDDSQNIGEACVAEVDFETYDGVCTAAGSCNGGTAHSSSTCGTSSNCCIENGAAPITPEEPEPVDFSLYRECTDVVSGNNNPFGKCIPRSLASSCTFQGRQSPFMEDIEGNEDLDFCPGFSEDFACCPVAL